MVPQCKSVFEAALHVIMVVVAANSSHRQIVLQEQILCSLGSPARSCGHQFPNTLYATSAGQGKICPSDLEAYPLFVYGH